MSETWIPVPAGSPFPLGNLPFGVGHSGDGRRHAWTAIGDSAVDLDALARAGALGLVQPGWFDGWFLNGYLAAGPDVWGSVRWRLVDVLTDPTAERRFSDHVVPRSWLTMGVPVAPTDYVDFYSSLHHATNLGRLFRPDGDALLPNWRHLPIGYHGRTGTLVADGSDIVRPHGQRLVDGTPVLGPTEMLDIELEVGSVVGLASDLGTPVDIADAGDHLYGMCLVNDWSARDVQAFEYQPLGPFLGKSFATSVSPWLVSLQALEPFRVAAPRQEPTPADYLVASGDGPDWGFDLHLEVWLESAQMRVDGRPPVRISRCGFADMYWTPAQQLAHLTINGASVLPGDLFASGTVSGPDRGSEGSLIEMTWRGERPIELPDGTERAFLEDGDRVELRGWAGDDEATRIGLGSVTGTVVPARREH